MCKPCVRNILGLVYDGGDLYVSEDLGGRIVQIMDNDAVIPPRVVKDGLSSPQGLAIANGYLYVVEAGEGRLLAVDLSSGDTKTVATGMSFSTGKLDMADTRNWTRSSIAISDKTAYIGGAGSGSIYKVGIQSCKLSDLCVEKVMAGWQPAFAATIRKPCRDSCRRHIHIIVTP